MQEETVVYFNLLHWAADVVAYNHLVFCKC